ncbi:glycoside hydrolase family 18 protein [Catalinimonas niigatensis]|uniref:glycoside hydrolase family 18 protein n=1 Tax=Catalinimonas niigatensis TaxID=1397264 RepID=UPI0026666023|nr:glycoside hydrolase family 18 protein [Catalinimonas niigatensis]WPP51207.1 glycoside hydrolase family 18 protein [Catalinimonas niigatensis]
MFRFSHSFSILSLLLLTLNACQQAPSQEVAEVKPVLNIMAYYVPEKNYQPEKLPLDQLTHIIYSFSKVIDGEMGFSDEDAPEKLRKLVDQKQNHPHIKVMLACGGWGAGGFSDMSVTAEGREQFIQSTVDIINEYQLDGIDMDWEYPAIGSAGIDFRPEDKQNFTLLMKGLREAMDAVNPELILTFASAGWQRYYDFIELTEVMKYADYMNVMTYDAVGGNTPYTAHHTGLGLVTEDDVKDHPFYEYVLERRAAAEEGEMPYQPRSAEWIINYCMEQGVDPQQIVIGGAFYGRAWKGVPPENNGLYQPNQGVHTGWATYNIIRDEYENKNGYTRYWDEIGKAPYLYNPTDSVFISYDDTLSLKLKTEYAIEKNLAGIMFWQLASDTKEENSLLDAIYETATKEVDMTNKK